MGRRRAVAAFTAAVMVALVMCTGALASQNTLVITPKNPIESVIKMSQEYALKQGRDPGQYFISKAEYDWSKKEWAVFFQGSVPAPGHHFLITLDENTGKMRLMRGE